MRNISAVVSAVERAWNNRKEKNERRSSFLKSTYSKCWTAIFQIGTIFAKTSNRTIAFRLNHKIERLAIVSRHNRRERKRESRSIDFYPLRALYPSRTRRMQRRQRIFQWKKSISPVIYLCALIMRFAPNLPLSNTIWMERRKRAEMVENRQSAVVISWWTKARGWSYQEKRGWETSTPDSSCSISASESSPPPI